MCEQVTNFMWDIDIIHAAPPKLRMWRTTNDRLIQYRLLQTLKTARIFNIVWFLLSLSKRNHVRKSEFERNCRISRQSVLCCNFSCYTTVVWVQKHRRTLKKTYLVECIVLWNELSSVIIPVEIPLLLTSEHQNQLTFDQNRILCTLLKCQPI